MLPVKHVLSASLLFGLFANCSAYAAGLQDGEAIPHNTPKFVSTARNMGQVEPNAVIDVSIWLKPHDQAGMDQLARDLYDPSSPQYRHWLTKAEFSARFAPTAAEAGMVAQFFATNHMKVVKVGPDNFFVRATGTAAAISTAFHVSLNNYEVDGKIVRANSEDPYVSGEVASVVKSVAGLDTMQYTHPLATRTTPQPVAGATAGSLAAVSTPRPEIAPRPEAASAGATTAPRFNLLCFVGQANETYTTSGGLPKATYVGNKYTTAPSGCGYTPQNIRTAYGLNALYAEGYDGTGQTIVIIDWCGSPTIMADANAFSAQFGLPALTSQNFKIINTPTPSYCEAPDTEINLDVEWAHAIAPGANIDLVVPPTANLQDVDQAFFYAVNYQLGNSISGSYGSEELYTPTSVLQTENLVTETAAVLGISANFSTGDQGDFTHNIPTFFPASVSAPASSPYATAVGGVSLSLHLDSTINWQIGWGTNENPLASAGQVTDPPIDNAIFTFGSGGGESGYFPKPAFQNRLPGTGRELPDISWLADPFTGAYIAISEPLVTPELQYESIGGTSLACPMFSALWAIANQEAGAPLGQAAPYLYSMPRKTIYDIVPYSYKSDVTGVVTDSSGKTSYSALDLAAPYENSPAFISVLWDYPLSPGTAYLLTFGTDTSLTVAPGWDNVTGLGVPNAKAFADYFKK